MQTRFPPLAPPEPSRSKVTSPSVLPFAEVLVGLGIALLWALI